MTRKGSFASCLIGTVRNVYTGPLLLPAVPPWRRAGQQLQLLPRQFDHNGECEQLLNLTVDIHVTEDLVLAVVDRRNEGVSAFS